MKNFHFIYLFLLICQSFYGQKTCFDAANKYRYDDLLKDSVKSNYPFDSLTAYIKRAQAMTINCQLLNDTFTTVFGKHSSIHSFKGKVLIIDFWSVYCIPCINAFPSFNSLLKKYPGKLNVLGVTLDQKEAVLNFLKKHEFNAQIIADAKSFLKIIRWVAAILLLC